VTRTSRRDRLNRRFKQLQEKADRAERQGDTQKALACYEEMLEIIQGAAALLGNNGRERILKQRLVDKIESLGGSVDTDDLDAETDEDFPEVEIDDETDSSEADRTAAESDAYELIEPEMHFEDIGGRRETKRVIRDRVIEPIRRADEYDQYELTAINGVLLFGPPGTGKTMLAKAAAAELDVPMLMADNATLKNRYHGESEGNVRDLFEAARTHQPCVIFLDDGEGLLQSRNDIDGPKADMVRQFLTEMTELKDEEVLTVATTNKPEQLDHAALRPERFTEQIKIGYPPEDTRAAVLRKQLSKGSRSEVLNEADINVREIAAQTHGYSCADLTELANMAALKALQHGEPITQRHLREGLGETQASMAME
jgi:SpoVK/Ycf46/Vps4 family AAA+-type ATPase